MRKPYRMIALVVVLAMLLSTSAFAAETRSSAYLFSYSGTLTKASTGKMCISFDVTGMGIMTAIGASIVRVYKSNGTLMKTYNYTDTGCSGMLAYNTFFHASSLTYSGTTGQSYYCIIKFTCFF